MLNDPRFHTIVRILFWGGLALSMVFLGFIVFARFQEASESTKDRKGAITLEEREGRLIVPEKDLPDSLKEKLRAPSAAIIPSRYEGVPVSPVPDKEKKKILSASKTFIERWDLFSPGDQRYAFRLGRLVRKDSLPDVVSRSDTISLEDVCPGQGCLFGMRPASSPELRVGDYDGKRAYVVGYGLVYIVAAAGQEKLHNQSYGILLYKTSRGWLVERAAGETLGPADSS